MKLPLLLTIPALTMLTACSGTPPCEDILEVKKQMQTCQRLQAIMDNAKNPQQTLTARKRFVAECENLRYYRDDYDTICKGSQKPLSDKPLLKTKDDQ